MVGLFSSIGEHMPIFREDKMIEATPESWVNITIQFQSFHNSVFFSTVGEQAALPYHLHAPLSGSLAGHLHRVDLRCFHTVACPRSGK